MMSQTQPDLTVRRDLQAATRLKLAPNWADNLPWAIILAGGEGTRLRPLTRVLAGDERPKQFCKIIGGETLLQQTTRRVGGLVRPERTVVVVTRSQARYLDSPLFDTPVLAQPQDRGTAPAILYSLLSISSHDPNAHVALFPSDHYFADDAVFMGHVAQAFGAVKQRPDLVILLGIVPHSPEVDYGWIQPGARVRGVAHEALFEVQQFWEKPPRVAAEQLLAMGCLWNSFVVVSSADALLGLMQRTVPDLCDAFHDAQAVLGNRALSDFAEIIYSQIPSVDFSREVLSPHPHALTVLPVANAGWVDVGRPERVRALLNQTAAQLRLYGQSA